MSITRDLAEIVQLLAKGVRLDVQTRLTKRRTRRTIRRNDRICQEEGIPLPPCEIFIDLMNDYPTLELEVLSTIKDDTARHDGRLIDLIANVNRLAAERRSEADR